MKLRTKKARDRANGRVAHNKAAARTASRIDPTRTIMLRRQHMAAVKRQFSLLKVAVRKLLVDDDAFGMGERVPFTVNVYCATGEGGGVDPSCSSSGGGVVSAAATKTAVEAYKKLRTNLSAVGVVEVRAQFSTIVSTLSATDALQMAKELGYSYRTKKEAVTGLLQALEGMKISQIRADIIGGLTVENVYCATGEGGGVDPSCSPGGGTAVGGSEGSGTVSDTSASVPEAINSYIHLGYQINDRLRDGRKMPAFLVDELKNIDAGMRPLGQNMTLYRGSGGEELDGLSVGSTFTDKAYVSTTVNRAEGESFGGASGYLITIKAAASDNAINISEDSGHKEVVLARDSTYRILAIDRTERTATLEVSKGAGGVAKPKLPVQTPKAASGEMEQLQHQLKSARGMMERATLRRQIRELTGNTTNAVGQYRFGSSVAKIAAFQAWLRKKLKQTITGVSDQKVWERYAVVGYHKGAGRAFDDTRRSERVREEGTKPLGFAEGTKDQFLRSSFGNPVAVAKIKLLAGRTFDELKNVTTDMSTKMSRTLTDGLVQGKGAREVARDLVDDVEFGQKRALVIARTELIRAHAEGQLDALEQLGVAEVGVEVEWSTTCQPPDECGVCPECQAMGGTIIAIADAHGMIPMHPNCRCSWIPWIPPQGRAEPVTLDEPTENAVGRFSRLLRNVYCPTGDGGGVDPSCSSSGSGSTGIKDQLREFNAVVQQSHKAIKGGAHPKVVEGDVELAKDKLKAAVGGKVEVAMVHVKRALRDDGKADQYRAIKDEVDGKLEDFQSALSTRAADPATDSPKQDRLSNYKQVATSLKQLADTIRWAKSRAGIVTNQQDEWEIDEVENVYCPTGEGGGVDPTCSPSSSSTVDLEDMWSDYGSGETIKSISRGEIPKVGSHDINGGEITSDDISKYKDVAEKLQKLASSSNTGHPEVWRGFVVPDGTDVKSMFKKNSIHEFNGLTAVSHIRGVAENYTDPQFIGADIGEAVLLRIGRNGGVVGHNNMSGELAGGESIIPSGSRFRVVGHRRENGVHIVDLYDKGNLNRT